MLITTIQTSLQNYWLILKASNMSRKSKIIITIALAYTLVQFIRIAIIEIYK